MLIVLGFYKRRPDFTYEQFSEHWRNVHGPLFHKAGLARYFRRYVQHNLRPNTAMTGYAALDFDGFSESWFDDIESRKEFLSQPEFREMIIPDERTFLNMEATRVQMFDTQVVQVAGSEYAPVLDILLPGRSWSAGDVRQSEQ